MTPLDTLIERVRGLEGPNYEIERQIFEMFDSELYKAQFPALRVPTYTVSLDAVVDLIERELPCCINTHWCPESELCNARLVNWRWTWADNSTVYAEAKTLPLALLLAFLTAMKEKGE